MFRRYWCYSDSKQWLSDPECQRALIPRRTPLAINQNAINSAWRRSAGCRLPGLCPRVTGLAFPSDWWIWNVCVVCCAISRFLPGTARCSRRWPNASRLTGWNWTVAARSPITQPRTVQPIFVFFSTRPDLLNQTATAVTHSNAHTDVSLRCYF